jgi:hypothetical protein
MRCYAALESTLDRMRAQNGTAMLATTHVRHLDLVDGPHVAKSTVQYRFGRRASASLLNRLQTERSALRAAQPYSDAVESIGAELKVWTYWTDRELWVTGLENDEEPDRRSAVESLVRVVVEWARRRPAVASQLSYAPPVAAVEDLVTLSPARVDPRYATRLLSDVVQASVEGTDRSPAAVWQAVRDPVMSVIFGGDHTVTHTTGAAYEALSTLMRIVPTLTGQERRRLASELGPALATLTRMLHPSG